MSRAAMQQALAYIEEVDYGPYDKQPVVTALKQALAEPQTEDTLRRENEWLKDDLHDAARLALSEYERGFVDGMSEQAKRSVDKAVNHMAQTTHWEGCEAVHPECRKPEQKSWFTVEELNEFATKLKEKAWKA